MSTQNVNVARFARNVEWDFFCDFQTSWSWCSDQIKDDHNNTFSFGLEMRNPGVVQREEGGGEEDSLLLKEAKWTDKWPEPSQAERWQIARKKSTKTQKTFKRLVNLTLFENQSNCLILQNGERSELLLILSYWGHLRPFEELEEIEVIDVIEVI